MPKFRHHLLGDRYPFVVPAVGLDEQGFRGVGVKVICRIGI